LGVDDVNRKSGLKAFRETLIALVFGATVAVAGLLGAGVAAASAVRVERCETVTVAHQHWGVYVESGRVNCATAGTVLVAVASGKAKDVDKGPADEYWLYKGWACPYNQMGETVCQYGSKPIANPTRVIVARDCVTASGANGCPTWAKLT